MNSIIKQIIKIADKEKIEILSINPIFNEMKEMENFLIFFRNLEDNYELELDSVYIAFSEDGNNILFQVIDNKVKEESIIKINPKKIREMLEQYYEMEENEENEEIGLFN